MIRTYFNIIKYKILWLIQNKKKLISYEINNKQGRHILQSTIALQGKYVN